MVLVDVIREVTYQVRQGSVTCRDLSIYKQMYLSKDKLITSCGLGIYEMGIYKVVI